jgi:polar amino acid transport system substrate-binding protein
MTIRIWQAGGLALAAIALTIAGASAQTLEKIKERGKIVVGVKADYKPFGFRDPSGKIVGFEPDLAQSVADALGVKLELEPVVSSNRMQFLQQGKIDLMIATMNDKPDRRQVVGIIEPSYYASSVTMMAPTKAGLKQWEQLKGQKVCAIQGAWYNKPIAEKYGVDIVAFKGTTEAQTAMVQGNCVGWVYDDTAFPGLLEDKAKWGDYEAVLPPILPDPWGLAVPLPEREKAFGRFMAGMVYEWHRSGHIAELEKKWQLPASPFVAAMHQKFAAVPTN